MKKFFKIVGILFGLALLLVVGLSLFVNFYFTDQRVKSLLVPRLEKTLGRQVAIDHLDVGLLRGITVKGFAVKEKSGTGDFFQAKEFVLRYDLLPLLHGRLLITEAILREPVIRIVRDQQGQFNFQTLAFLQKSPEQEPVKGGKPVALPLALTIDQIGVQKARFSVTDQLGKLPAVNGTGDVSISVDTKNGKLDYYGRYDFAADVAYQKWKPHLAGKGGFDSQMVSYQVDTTVGDQTVHVGGKAENWQTSPQVRLNLSAKQLDVDRLLALLGGTAQVATPSAATGKAPAAAPPTPEAKKPAQPLAAALPSGLTTTGSINIAQAKYQNLEIQQLTGSYELKQGVLVIKDLSAAAAGGKILGGSRIDLTHLAPSYTATMNMYAMQAGQLAALLSAQYGNWLTGNLNSTVRLAGSGTAWPQVKKTLTVNTDFTVRNGQLREFPITTAVSDLLGLPELRSPSFQKLTGTLKVRKGRVLLNSNLAGQDLQAKVNGTVGLDGQLDLPVTLRLTGSLAREIQARTSLAQYLTGSGGGVAIDFKLSGKVSQPHPMLNLGATGQRVKEQVEKKAVRELQRFLQKNQPAQQKEPPSSSPFQDLLKRFGR